MNLSRLLCSLLRKHRRLSEINARGLWHAIHFNLRSVSFMTRDNDDVLVPLVYLLLLVAAGVRSVSDALHTRSAADRPRFMCTRRDAHTSHSSVMSRHAQLLQ